MTKLATKDFKEQIRVSVADGHPQKRIFPQTLMKKSLGWAYENPTSIETLRQFLSYDANTGELTLLRKTSTKNIAGQKVSSISHGYIQFRMLGRSFYGHRVAWALHYGSWPHGIIDHINQNTLDNRIVNLRDVDKTINGQNRYSPQYNNSSKYLGVHWDKARKKWKAQITTSGKTMQLGRFDSEDEAHLVYMKAKRAFHEGCTR